MQLVPLFTFPLIRLHKYYSSLTKSIHYEDHHYTDSSRPQFLCFLNVKDQISHPRRIYIYEISLAKCREFNLTRNPPRLHAVAYYPVGSELRGALCIILSTTNMWSVFFIDENIQSSFHYSEHLNWPSFIIETIPFPSGVPIGF